MASRPPGPVCAHGKPQDVCDGTLNRSSTAVPGPTIADGETSSDALLARILGRSIFTQSHVDAVIKAINPFIKEAIDSATDPKTGRVIFSRFKILLRAVLLCSNYRSKNDPDGRNLVLRDADHYLSARTAEFSLHKNVNQTGEISYEDDLRYPGDKSKAFPTVKEVEPTWRARFMPLISYLYASAKAVGFIVQEATRLGANELKQKIMLWPPGSDRDFALKFIERYKKGWNPTAYAGTTPSQNGGVEWDAYGHYHYEQLDMGNLTKLEPPPLLESDKLESLQLCAMAYFIPR